MGITSAQLSAIMPKCRPGSQTDVYAQDLSDAMDEGDINTVPRMAAFFGKYCGRV